MHQGKNIRHTRRIGILLASLMGLAGCIAFDTDGNWYFDPPDVSSPSAWIDDLRDRIANHDATVVRDFAMREFEALHSNDPAEMEKLLDIVASVNEHAPSLPGIQTYASWINSRMAYFEAAEAMKQAKQQPSIIHVPQPQPELEPELRLPSQQPERDPKLRLPSQQRPTGGPPVPPTHPATAVPPKTPLTPPPTTPVARSPQPVVTKATPDGRTGRVYWQQAVQKHRRPTGADAMLPRIKPAFRANGLPEELAWIAEVESSMDPTARSPVGARGLFQLMPRTAESLGLKLAPKDERLVPEHNAQAAAKYLRTLYKRFGSWPLTLAAYNAGEGRVSKLCRKHNTQRFDVIAANLPNETQMYVPRVLETIRLRTGIDPDTLPAPTL